MCKVLLLSAAMLCLVGCATSPEGHGFNLGSMEMGHRTEVQLRLERVSADAMTATEKQTVDMARRDSGRNSDMPGLGLKWIRRF